jgi:hypothetical protein
VRTHKARRGEVYIRNGRNMSPTTKILAKALANSQEKDIFANPIAVETQR